LFVVVDVGDVAADNVGEVVVVDRSRAIEGGPGVEILVGFVKPGLRVSYGEAAGRLEEGYIAGIRFKCGGGEGGDEGAEDVELWLSAEIACGVWIQRRE
jgi:hypothetical protein